MREMTHLFFFMEAVFMEAGCRVTASATPPSQVNHCPGYCSCRASHLSFQGTWRCGAVPEDTHWLCQAGTCHHCPCPLSHCVQPGKERGQGNLCAMHPSSETVLPTEF